MKHIFLGEEIEKTFYLGVKVKSFVIDWSMDYYIDSIKKRNEHEIKTNEVGLCVGLPVKIEWDENRHDFKGEIHENIHRRRWFVVKETEGLLRELEIGERAYIDKESFKIQDKSYGLDGEIIYYIKLSKFIEDENSKKVANEQLEKRKSFLKEKEEVVKLEQLDYMIDCDINKNKQKGFWGFLSRN